LNTCRHVITYLIDPESFNVPIKLDQPFLIATVSSSQHILNNLLNQIHVVFLEMDDEYRVDAKTREMLKQSLRDAQAQDVQLSEVVELDEETIRESVAPK
jgi:hypothetical protein